MSLDYVALAHAVVVAERRHNEGRLAHEMLVEAVEGAKNPGWLIEHVGCLEEEVKALRANVVKEANGE